MKGEINDFLVNQVKEVYLKFTAEQQLKLLCFSNIIKKEAIKKRIIIKKKICQGCYLQTTVNMRENSLISKIKIEKQILFLSVFNSCYVSD